MSNEFFRPTPKKIFTKKNPIVIHPSAQPAYHFWKDFFLEKPGLGETALSGYYRTTPKFILDEVKNGYWFFENFEYMYHSLSSNLPVEIFALILPESEQDIELCAWAEVLQLPFRQRVNPAEFLKSLEHSAPSATIQKLMGVKKFTRTAYLEFYGLNKDSATYYQKKIRQTKREKLPQMAEWIKNSTLFGS